MENIQPNRFTLQSCDGVTKVEYETTSFIGQPFLNLTEGSGPTRHFTGSQIRTQNTEIGTLITVTTNVTVDSGSTSFTVLIPSIGLSSVSDQETFATEAVVTFHSGPLSGPQAGVHETYRFMPMNGEAQFLLFFFEPVVTALSKAAAM
jgi:hypothetical protein